MKPVVWGILSVSGHYQLRVHTNLKKSPLVDLRAIASRSHEKAAAAAKRLGIAKSYGSYEELLSDREIEAIYIPLPNHMHAEWVRKATDAGKHVLCEKPFAMDAREAEQTVLHAKSKGVLVMEAFMYRFHPQWRKAREVVGSGEIGELHSIHAMYTYMLTDPGNIRNNVGTGGGGINDVGCYLVSCSRFLMDREPTRVVSLVQRDAGMKTDILASAILDFGTARAAFTVGTQTHSTQHVEVIGSGGEMTIPLPFNAYADIPMQITVTNGVGTRTIFTLAIDQYVEMFEEFSRAIREGGTAQIPPQDAIDNMKVLDALFRSEKSGGWEKVG